MEAADCYPDKAEIADTIFEDLSHHIRREVIYLFENVTDQVSTSVDKLVSHISTRMPDLDPEQLKIDLHHTHLPKLQSTGWIEYDKRSQEVRYYGHESVYEVLCMTTEMFL